MKHKNDIKIERKIIQIARNYRKLCRLFTELKVLGGIATTLDHEKNWSLDMYFLNYELYPDEKNITTLFKEFQEDAASSAAEKKTAEK